LDHEIGIDLTVSSILKKPSKDYACYILRCFRLFLIHLQSKNKTTLGNGSNSKAAMLSIQKLMLSSYVDTCFVNWC